MTSDQRGIFEKPKSSSDPKESSRAVKDVETPRTPPPILCQNMALGQNLRYLFGVGKATPRSSLFKRLFGCSPGYRGFDPLPHHDDAADAADGLLYVIIVLIIIVIVNMRLI